jgi:hypothetical protein
VYDAFAPGEELVATGFGVAACVGIRRTSWTTRLRPEIE